MSFVFCSVSEQAVAARDKFDLENNSTSSAVYIITSYMS